jgi:hypothetical protein
VLTAAAGLLAACAHDTYQPEPLRVEAPAGPTAFHDCELDDGSTVPSDFPKGALAPVGPAEHALACGLSGQLAALGEPSFFPLSPSAEVYRVLWIRSDGHPVSVRLDRQGDGGQIRAAQTSGKGLAPAGELLEESTALATPATVRSVVISADAARFWATAPAPAPLPTSDRGSTWIFEGVRAGQYRVRLFRRDTLAMDPAYSALARTMIGVSGLHIQGAVY